MTYRYRVLAFLSSLSIITYIDRVCISVAGKTIQEELGLTIEQWGWVLGAFVLAYGIFELPSGAMGDRIGPRRGLMRIVVWWSAFTALTGAIRSYWPLLGTRFLFGAGEAGAFPNISGAIARWFPRGERARAQGVVWMASRIGGAVAPLVVVHLQQAWGWRATFYVLGMVGVAWAIVWYRWFRDDPAEMVGISAKERSDIGESPVASSHSGRVWRQILVKPNLWWIMFTYHAQAWAGFFYLTWLFTFLENGRGYSKQDLVALSWLPFAFGAVANIVGGFASDALVDRIGLKWGRRLIGIGGLGAAAVFTAATIFTHDKVTTVVLLAFGYGCSDFTMPAVWAVCLDVGHQAAGTVTGAMNMAGQVGSFLSTVFFGYFVNAFGSYDAPLIPIALMLGIGAVTWSKIDATTSIIDDHS